MNSMTSCSRASGAVSVAAFQLETSDVEDRAEWTGREAIEAGANPAALREEDEFAALHDDPEFQALTQPQVDID